VVGRTSYPCDTRSPAVAWGFPESFVCESLRGLGTSPGFSLWHTNDQRARRIHDHAFVSGRIHGRCSEVANALRYRPHAQRRGPRVQGVSRSTEDITSAQRQKAVVLCSYFSLRRKAKPNPTNPTPRSATLFGSGIVVVEMPIASPSMIASPVHVGDGAPHPVDNWKLRVSVMELLAVKDTSSNVEPGRPVSGARVAVARVSNRSQPGDPVVCSRGRPYSGQPTPCRRTGLKARVSRTASSCSPPYLAMNSSQACEMPFIVLDRTWLAIYLSSCRRKREMERLPSL
jgi:hypothetical protein